MDLKKQIAYLNGYQDAEREGERTKQEFLFWKRRIPAGGPMGSILL